MPESRQERLSDSTISTSAKNFTIISSVVQWKPQNHKSFQVWWLTSTHRSLEDAHRRWFDALIRMHKAHSDRKCNLYKCDRVAQWRGHIWASWNNKFIQCITLPTKSFLDTWQFHVFKPHHSIRYIILGTRLYCPRFEQNRQHPIPSSTSAGPWSSWIIFYSAIKWISTVIFVSLFCILKLLPNQWKAAFHFLLQNQQRCPIFQWLDVHEEAGSE